MTPATVEQVDLLAILLTPAPPAQAPAKPAKRHFYRCADCLSVVASEVNTERRNPPHYYYSYGLCGACGGDMEYMGVTERDRLVKHGLECPCDGRCTGALGPSCDCRCGGANHGSNRVVEVTYDAGAIPTFQVTPDARVKADEYRALSARVMEAITTRFGSVIERKYRGEYLDSVDFDRYLKGTWFKRSLTAARALRSHAGRNKKMTAILAEVAGR